MVYKIALSISLIAVAGWSHAQNADDYFHGGAQSFIHAEKEKAKQEIFTGLQKFPEDPKLNGMAGLLKKQEEEKQKQQQQQQQQQQDQQKDQSKNEKSQDSQQDKSEQEKQESSEQKQEAKSEEEKKQEQAKQSQEQKDKQQKEQQEKEQQQADQASGKPDDKSDGKDGEKTYALGQMTPQQAQQLLDAQKNEEKLIPVKPTGKPTDRSRPIRDW